MPKIKKLSPQYMIDKAGNKTGVILDILAFEQLLEEIEDIYFGSIAHKALQEENEYIAHENVKKKIAQKESNIKKGLFILLTFILLFFTSAEATRDKPTNVVLSTHLIGVRNDIKQELQQFSQEDNKLQQKLDQDYTVTTNIFNNFFDITSLTDIFAKIEQLWFYLICNYMKTIYTVNDTDSAIIQQALVTLNIQDSYITQLEYLKANWVQIIKPLLITYCSPNDTRTSEEQMNDLILSDDSLSIGYNIINKQILTPLLQDIENKIKTL